MQITTGSFIVAMGFCKFVNKVVRKLQFQNNFLRKKQNTMYFARLVRQLTELLNKSVIFWFPAAFRSE
jgi:hypothetical protein